MKTILKSLIVTGVIFFAAGSLHAQTATAAGDKQSVQAPETAAPGKFVDKNNNGICDNREARQAGQGRNYVDRNGDGICDNRTADNPGNGKGYGCGNGYRHGWGQGNGKGKCYGQAQGCCRGYGQGNQHRHGWGGGNQATPEPTGK